MPAFKILEPDAAQRAPCGEPSSTVSRFGSLLFVGFFAVMLLNPIGVAASTTDQTAPQAVTPAQEEEEPESSPSDLNPAINPAANPAAGEPRSESTDSESGAQASGKASGAANETSPEQEAEHAAPGNSNACCATVPPASWGSPANCHQGTWRCRPTRGCRRPFLLFRLVKCR